MEFNTREYVASALKCYNRLLFYIYLIIPVNTSFVRFADLPY